MDLYNEIEQKVLPFVRKPAAYTNNELNSVHKEWHSTDIHVALCYPDLYEIGSSNLGIQILYDIVNTLEYAVVERLFAPADDCENLLRKTGLPLFSLESRHPISDFDLLAISMQTELTYTNILNILDLSSIPLYAADRTEAQPFICAGGASVFNPEPMADFFDFFIIGEAEEVLVEVTALLRESRKSGRSRRETLLGLACIPGVYVPMFYDVVYNKDGTVKVITPNDSSVPAVVNKRTVADLNTVQYPLRPLVPYTEIVHDRCVVEIMRGCRNGCRFCQAGFVTRPTRERGAEQVIAYAEELIRQTGYEEVSLISLSSSDYSGIETVAETLGKRLAAKKVSLSLPSLRADTVSRSLSSQLTEIRKAGFTLAPEAGTQRLRDRINKNLTEEQILTAVRNVFSAGVQAVKLYFMIGLPGETDEDIHGIAGLAQKIVDISRLVKGHKLKRVVVNTSIFVPKTHTPFQWASMIPEEEIYRKIHVLKRELRHPKIQFRYHEINTSILEGILARGDRRLSAVIADAFRHGCKFDAWREHFNFAAWKETFSRNGIDIGFYTTRERSESEMLPWDHLHAGVSRNYLWNEYELASSGVTTLPCMGNCKKCGVCS